MIALGTNSLACAELAAPAQVHYLRDAALSDAQWQALAARGDLAYVVQQGTSTAAFCPGPSGAAATVVTADTWRQILAGCPALGDLRPREEAVLLCRLFGQRMIFRVPVQVCDLLSGLIRAHWSGLTGGTELWKQVQAFFTDLRAVSDPRCAVAE